MPAKVKLENLVTCYKLSCKIFLNTRLSNGKMRLDAKMRRKIFPYFFCNLSYLSKNKSSS